MGGEVEDGPYLFATEPIKHLYDFVNRKRIFEILKDGLLECGIRERPMPH